MTQSALQSLCALISKRSYTTHQIRQKLTSKNYSAIETQQAIEQATQLHLLRDDLAASTLASRYIGVKGKKHVSQMLARAGIEETIVQQELDTYEEKLTPGTIAKIKRKLEIKTTSYEKKSWLHSYLARNGYTTIQELTEKYNLLDSI